jgi:hypothetical protein
MCQLKLLPAGLQTDRHDIILIPACEQGADGLGSIDYG